MMELKEGMYVRYVSGFHHNKSDKPIVLIGKILRVDDYINLDTFFGGGVYPTKDFKKLIIGEPSFNIIDLIEVGDYVNGHQVYEVDRVCCRITLNGGDIGSEAFRLTYLRPALGKNMGIKSIVTKKQFESMEYKVN